METTSTTQFAVTYGRTDFFADEGLKTVFVSSVSEVKAMAVRFVTVIPDDPETYLEAVDNWTGTDTLSITHQDDDTFLFAATPVATTTDFSDFDTFIDSFAVAD